MTMMRLVRNESTKLLRRRRFLIVIAILLSVTSVITYAQHRQLERGKRDWRVETQQRIARYRNVLQRAQMNPSWSRSLRAEVARLQYYADHDIDPERPTAPFFARNFANVAGFLLLPLLVAVLASDIVSAEHAEGTDRLLLTRPVRRWKVLLSKILTVFLFASLTLLCGGLISYAISSLALDPRGWGAPVFSGFRVSASTVDVSGITELPMWLDTILAYGVEWFALLSVASVGILLSVIFRSSAASIGAMLAALIGGTIITRVSPDWLAGKYLFVSALPMAAYYSGEPPPYDGMTLTFCALLLAGWASGALIAAFVLFTRRDVLG